MQVHTCFPVAVWKVDGGSLGKKQLDHFCLVLSTRDMERSPANVQQNLSVTRPTEPIPRRKLRASST